MVASKFIQPDGHLLIDESNINEVSKADLMDYMNYVVSIVPLELLVTFILDLRMLMGFVGQVSRGHGERHA